MGALLGMSAQLVAVLGVADEYDISVIEAATERLGSRDKVRIAEAIQFFIS